MQDDYALLNCGLCVLVPFVTSQNIVRFVGYRTARKNDPEVQ